MSIDKLQGIRGDLVRTDDNWREWNFSQFVEALRKWTERNPIPAEPTETQTDRKKDNKPCFSQDKHFKLNKRTNNLEYVFIVRNLSTNQLFAKQSRQWMSMSCIVSSLSEEASHLHL